MISKTVRIYIDGSCFNDTRKGGWAAVMTYDQMEKLLSGVATETTNQRMELTAAIEALKAMKKKDLPTQVYTDSQYVVNIANGCKARVNIDLVDELRQLLASFTSLEIARIHRNHNKADKFAHRAAQSA
ncbi:MAG: reverse transcriptase-like protein [Anaerolineae bacterium]|nr:reverse transcriptase-like protein [Anaerolineae bacterium]